MAAVGVARHVLVHRLHADLEARAAVVEHVAQVLLQTVVGPSLDGDADAFGLALLRVLDGLGNRTARVALKRFKDDQDDSTCVSLNDSEKFSFNNYFPLSITSFIDMFD